MQSDAVILARLDAIERQNRQVLEMLARIAWMTPANHHSVCMADPYAQARQLAREGKRAEAVAETKRVNAMLAEQERREKKGKG